MKRLFYVTILVLLYQQVAGQVNNINSYSVNSYDGNIISKNKIDTIYAVRHQGEVSTTFVFCFDRSGKITSEINYTNNDTLVNAYQLYYTAEGKLRSKVHYIITTTSEKKVDSITYSKNGLLEKKVITKIPGTKIETRHNYANQKLAEDITEINGSKIVNRYLYNNRGLLSSQISLYIEGSSKNETVISKQHFLYDAGGRLSSSSDSSISLFSTGYTTTYRYNAQNMLATIDKTDGSYSYNTYNGQGLPDKIEYSLQDPFRTGEFSGTELYTYIIRK
jgi:hypothetical protein